MNVEPRRSKFKKTTSQYNIDNVLDIIDIEDTLSKNRFIPKAAEDNFIYSKYLKTTQPTLILSQFINISDEIDFNRLNANKFNINFESLRLEYSNGYSIRLVDVYFPIEIIGEGSFGLVIGGIHSETKRKEAIKIIAKNNLTDSEKNTLNNEVAILNSLNHPRVMQLYEVLDTHDYFFIFMELIEGGSLRDLIINRYKDNNAFLFRDSECSEIMNCLLEALNYLQMKKIVHRDIKPENIMLKVKNDFSSIVLCDFGIACKTTVSSSSIEGKCGTTLYMSPEIIEGRKYDHLVDSWSAGIVLYILVSGGEHPLYQKSMSQQDYEDQLLKKKPITFSEHIPLLARNLFFKLCKYEPFYRYGPFKALRHPWITRCNKSQIPMTLIEEYEIKDKIKEFKSMLSISLFFHLYKSIYQLQLKQCNKKEKQFNTGGKIKLKRKDDIDHIRNPHSSREPLSLYSIKTKRLPALTEIKKNDPPKKLMLSRNSKISILLNQSSGDNSQLSTSSNPKLINKQKKKHIYLKTDINRNNARLFNNKK